MWEVIFYHAPNGTHPAADFIAAHSDKAQAKIARAIDLLEERGLALGMPYLRTLPDTGGLRELRVPFSGWAYRLFFFADGRTLVLVHGFAKRAKNCPPKSYRRRYPV